MVGVDDVGYRVLLGELRRAYAMNNLAQRHGLSPDSVITTNWQVRVFRDTQWSISPVAVSPDGGEMDVGCRYFLTATLLCM